MICGGAAVSIYTGNENDSSDIDFVSAADRKRIERALMSIGFEKSKSKNFSRAGTRITIELAGSFPMIGDSYVARPGTIAPKGEEIKIFTPTQTVMDRLSHFILWHDRQALRHAVEVARRHPIDLADVEAWAAKEQATPKYEYFLAELKRVGPLGKNG